MLPLKNTTRRAEMIDCNPAWRPSTPGEILRELYLSPHGISVASFARAIDVSGKHMNRIVNGHVAINADMAVKIASALGTTAQYWLNLQDAVSLYDAWEGLRKEERQPRRLPAFAELEAAD